MAGEQTVKLKDVCSKIGSGATPRGGKEAYKGGATTLIRSQNVYNEGFHRDGLVNISDQQAAELKNVELRSGDVLLNITGDSVARCCQVEDEVLPARVNQHVAIIRPRMNELDARFLRYVLISSAFQSHLLSLASAGATRNAITKVMIENLDVPRPPLAEQKRIAHILGTLDDKIELNRRMNKTLEEMARALFKSWFIDFDPVVAKSKGHKPEGMDATTAKLFPSSFEDSELGRIPKGWKVETLADLTELITKGTTPTQDEMASSPSSDKSINYVRVNSIDEEGSILSDKLTVIPESVHFGVLKRSILKTNDVLYTIAGTIGRITLAEDWVLPANTNQAVAIIRPKLSIPAGFLMLAMQQDAFREELHNNIVHAVQANLSLGMLSKARVVVPPITSLQHIFTTIASSLSQVSANREQSRTLATLRDTLLPKLLSGELSVNELKASAS